jgi:hypothetical protein
MRNDSPFSHTHEKWPRHAATDCYWSLSTLKPHFPSSVLPDVLSAHPEHRRPATASSMTSATTVRPLPCVVHIFLQLFFLPVFMVNWPVSDDVAELVADTILPSFLSTFVFPRLPCPPPPPQMTRYDTTHGGSRYWLIFSRLPAIMHTRFSLPAPQSSGLIHLHISLSHLPMYRIYIFVLFFLGFPFYPHCYASVPLILTP